MALPGRPALRAGLLRHKLAIQSASTTDGTLGKAQTVSYATVKTVNGDIRPLTGREFVNAKANDAQVTHEITIRYYEGLTPRHRFLFGTRIFNIEQIRNIEERNRMMIIMVKEDV
jgi:SPP1 family predicted phage head-tail adaptor